MGRGEELEVAFQDIDDDDDDGSVGSLGEELEVAFQDIDKDDAEEYNAGDNDDGDQQEEYVLGRISITMIKLDLFTSCRSTIQRIYHFPHGEGFAQRVPGPLEGRPSGPRRLHMQGSQPGSRLSKQK